MFPNCAGSIRMSEGDVVTAFGLCVLLRMWESDSQFARALNVMLAWGRIENVY